MSVADEIRKLAELKNEGLLTEEEFIEQKRVLLTVPEHRQLRDESNSIGSVATEDIVERPLLTPTKALLLAVAVIGLVIMFSSGGSPESKERQKDRDVIKVCWSDYEKKSNSSESMRFIAGVCEKLESDFQRRHGLKP